MPSLAPRPPLSHSLRCGGLGLLVLACLGCDSQRVATPSVPPAQDFMLDDEHALLAQVLAAVVHADGVDYAALRRDHATLDAYRAQLARTTVPADPRAKMALYINAYNAFTLALVVDLLPEAEARWPTWSIKDGGTTLQSVWKKYDFELAGQRITLDQLEHVRLRPMGEPRIHFAINCASRSCPALAATPYRARTLEADLTAAVRVFVDDPRQLRLVGDKLLVNPILDWFGADFAVVGGVRSYLRDHVVEGPLKAHLRGSGALGYFDYDWTLNLTRTPR